MVVAATSAGVIGSEGTMPWHLGRDLGRFKRLTMGGVLLMGRKTFDSIGRPLPGRQTIVLSRNPKWEHPGVHAVSSPGGAVQRLNQLAAAGFVVGGAEIYGLMLPYVSMIWLTQVWSSASGDTQIALDWPEFYLTEVTRFPQTGRDSAPTELQKWVRGKKSALKLPVPIES